MTKGSNPQKNAGIRSVQHDFQMFTAKMDRTERRNKRSQFEEVQFEMLTLRYVISRTGKGIWKDRQGGS